MSIKRVKKFKLHQYKNTNYWEKEVEITKYINLNYMNTEILVTELLIYKWNKYKFKIQKYELDSKT